MRLLLVEDDAPTCEAVQTLRLPRRAAGRAEPVCGHRSVSIAPATRSMAQQHGAALRLDAWPRLGGLRVSLQFAPAPALALAVPEVA